MMMEDHRQDKGGNVVGDKSYQFALRIIKAYKYIAFTEKEYVLSKQMLRSGTAIGALIREADYAQSKADFISKQSIALKEANETDYWISLLKDSGYMDERAYNSLIEDCYELIKLLTRIITTSKSNNKR